MRAPPLITLLYEYWQVSIPLTVAAATVGCLYILGVSRGRGRWPLRRTVSFLGGIGCVLVALESGIDAYSERLLSVHMTQHMLLLLVAPLLLLGGLPSIALLRALAPRRRRPLIRLLARLRGPRGSALSLAFFTAVVIGTHLPGFYVATLRHPLLHEAEHALYLTAGLFLWWPLLGSDPAPRHRTGGLGRLVYLLLAMAPMTLVGAYLNRLTTVLYAPYGPASRALGVSPVADQAQAGAIMWVAGDVIMVVVGLSAAVGALVAEERRQQRLDARSRTGLVTPGPGS